MHVSSRARRYARALASVAVDEKLEERVLAELQGLRDFFEEKPMARLVMESPASTTARQGDLLRAIGSAHDFTTPTQNLLRLLVANGRFHLFPEIVEGYAEELRRRAGIVRATVRTAQPLEAEQEAALRQVLESVTEGKKVQLVVKEDPELIAGTVTRIGSVVYDGSLANQLGRLREQLVSE